MFKLQLIEKDNDILNLEKINSKVFLKKEINNIKDSAYAPFIKSGDMMAFQCLDEDKIVGGMIIGLHNDYLLLERLFVDNNCRGKGAGSFMIDYLSNNKYIFEDYYGIDLKGIITEPTYTSIKFYYDNGFDYSGYQMYKKY